MRYEVPVGDGRRQAAGGRHSGQRTALMMLSDRSRKCFWRAQARPFMTTDWLTTGTYTTIYPCRVDVVNSCHDDVMSKLRAPPPATAAAPRRWSRRLKRAIKSRVEKTAK